MKKQSVILAFALFTGASTFAAVPQKLNAFSEGERLIYTKVVENFRKNLLKETIQQRDLLARNYPHSIHLDNAYYLTGVLQYQVGHYAEAIKDFGYVENHFALSNKRPAAMFAKARAYETLGLKPQATRLLNMIIKEYPGSQESQRAWMQLKVATLDSPRAKTKAK